MMMMLKLDRGIFFFGGLRPESKFIIIIVINDIIFPQSFKTFHIDVGLSKNSAALGMDPFISFSNSYYIYLL